MATKRICALTMVRDDEFFLRKWVEYYGSQLGKENLYVYFDGEDQHIPEFCDGINARICTRTVGNVHKADKGRIDFLSKQAATLLEHYDLVIGTDVDEFLIVDPQTGKSLPEYLSEKDVSPSISGLGLDMGHNLIFEKPIDKTKPVLGQRRYAYLSPRYTKANVISQPVNWGSGFHRVRGHNYHIDPNLFMVHMGCIDIEMLRKRCEETDRISNGWSRHLRKRAKTIRIVSKGKPRNWDRTVPVVRKLQRIIRPIYAWNKPSLAGVRIVVELPDRFMGLV